MLNTSPARSAPDPRTADVREEIARMIPALRAFAYALTRNPTDADDLLQESLLKALMHAHQYAPGSNLKAWLFTIERNTFCTNYRKQRREVTGISDEAIGGHAEPAQEWSLKMKALDRALQRLPAEQREVLMLVCGAGFSYEEAAEICGCALGTIRSRINRGPNKLLELLDVDAPERFLRNEERAY